MKKVLLITVTALAIGAAGSVQAIPITPAVEYTSTGLSSDTRTFTLGYKFSLSAPVTIDALAYWNDGLGNNHEVGIWDSGGVLLTSTTVLGTDPLVGHFRWDTIGAITLIAGTYTIGGQAFSGGATYTFPSSASGLTTIPQYTWIQSEQLFGPGLNFPTVTGNYGQNGIW